MQYTFELVKERGLSLPETQIQRGIEALNGLAKLTGIDWFEQKGIKNSQSPFYVYEAIQIWEDWSAIKDISRANSIAKRLRYDLNSAASEIFVGSRLVKGGLNVEIEPDLDEKKPDFRFRIDDQWIYLETTLRAVSQVLENSNKLLQAASSLVAQIVPGRHGMLAFLKPITLNEMPQINQWLNTVKDKAEAQLDGTAYYYSDPQMDSVIGGNDPLIKRVSKPRLFSTYFSSDGRAVITKGTACMQVFDSQAQEVLENEAKQLSKSAPGVICVDLSGVIGGLREWKPLIERRLQPNINTRISAVILIEKVMAQDGNLELKGALINNKFSINPITKSVDLTLQKIFNCVL